MRELIRTPITFTPSGETLGRVKDIFFDESNNTVTGIVLEKETLLHISQKRIAREDLLNIGKDRISLKQCKEAEVQGVRWSEKVGTKVYNEGGEIKGVVDDIFVDNDVRHILGYEITDGLFSDLIHGREAIFEENILADNCEVIVVEGGSIS